MKVIISDGTDGTAYDCDEDMSAAEIGRRLGHDKWHLAETQPLPPAELSAAQLAIRLGRFTGDPEVVVQVDHGDGEMHLHKVVALQGSPGRANGTLVPVPLLILGPEIQRVDW